MKCFDNVNTYGCKSKCWLQWRVAFILFYLGWVHSASLRVAVCAKYNDGMTGMKEQGEETQHQHLMQDSGCGVDY